MLKPGGDRISNIETRRIKHSDIGLANEEYNTTRDTSPSSVPGHPTGGGQGGRQNFARLL